MVHIAWNQCPQFKLTTIPQGLLNVFPNFQYFYLKNCRIAELTGNELDQYPNLIGISITESDLTYVPPNLVKNTPTIFRINLSHNQIANVASNVFAGLTNLDRLEFSDNPCFNGRAYDRKSVLDMITYLHTDCPAVVSEPPVCTITSSNVVEYACEAQKTVYELLAKNGDLERTYNDLVKQVQAITNN